MAIVHIGRQPELTRERARELFTDHFAGTYEVVRSNAISRDFIVRKNAWVGVGVRLKQDRTGTSFIFTGLIPNLPQQLLASGPGAFVFLRPSWITMEAEIASFIEAAFAAPLAETQLAA
jgi:hypothetical protein